MEKSVINVSLCLSDIVQGQMKKGSDGKIYLGIVVFPKTLDQYGYNMSIQHDLTEEERKSLVKPLYLGDGKFVDFKNENGTFPDKGMIKAVLVVSDFPKEKYVEGKNGKKYIWLTIFEGKKKNALDGLLYVSVQQNKEEREAQAKSVYVGYGKEIIRRESVDAMAEFVPGDVDLGF